MDSTKQPFISGISGLTEIAKEEPRLTVVSADQFAVSEPAPRNWLLNNSLPAGKVGMIVGAGGVGKSYFSLALGLAVASGTAVCDGLFKVERPGDVLIFNAEDDQEESHRRFLHLLSAYRKAASGKIGLSSQVIDLKRIENCKSRLNFVFISPGSCAIGDPGGDHTSLYQEILTEAKQIDNLRLIVLDPLRRFLSGNEDSSEVVADFIPLVERLASETGSAVLLVHHTSKQAAYKSSDHQFAARGSSALSDLVRWQLNIASVKGPEKVGLSPGVDYVQVTVSKNNYAPPQKDNLFLQRCEGGVLRFVHSSGHQYKLDNDVDIVVAAIKAAFEKGNVYSKTDLRKIGKSLGISLGQKAASDAIDIGIKLGRLVQVARPNHKAKGKRPMDVLPAGCEHP